MLESLKNNRPIEIWHLVVAVLALFVGIVGVAVAIYFGLRETVIVIRSDIEGVSTRVERVEKSILEQRFVITAPTDDSNVGLHDVVRGQTPFADMNHYIVVTPLKVGGDWVQEGPVKVYGGLWSGRAKFGSAAVGEGEKFVIRALATKSKLSSGTLSEVPDDAIFSEPVTVTRRL